MTHLKATQVLCTLACLVVDVDKESSLRVTIAETLKRDSEEIPFGVEVMLQHLTLVYGNPVASFEFSRQDEIGIRLA